MSDDDVKEMEIDEDQWSGLEVQGDIIPQSQKLAPYQVLNNTDGGYVFQTDYETRLRRFLCMGTDGGTYYTGEKELIRENAICIAKLINSGKGTLVVDTIKQFSIENRACKQNPIVYALALCCRSNDPKTKEAAYEALKDVCRIPTHLFQFAKYCQELSAGTGWGRAHRTGISNWYINYLNKKDGSRLLALHLTKYNARFGFSHKDIFRLSHIKPDGRTYYDSIFYLIQWYMKGKARADDAYDCRYKFNRAEFEESELKKMMAFTEVLDRAKKVTTEDEMARMILEHGLAREHVPTELLKSKTVWGALMRHMPMTAMIRNLGKMSSLGLLESDSFGENLTKEKLTNEVLLKQGRIHPFTLLVALNTYKKGHGELGKLKWTVNPTIAQALEDAFYLSFKNVKPTGKRFLLAVDVSGSMNVAVMGTPTITAQDAAAAMMMVTKRSETDCDIVAFAGRGMHDDKGLIELDITSEDKLIDVITKCKRLNFSSTNCALPILHAIENKKHYDVFIVYTDSETYYGAIHPSEALKNYRKMSPAKDARLCVCGMASNGFTIADPEDPLMMDFVGFDANAPEVIYNFVTGAI